MSEFNYDCHGHCNECENCAKNKWISVKDRLPEFDVIVLIYHQDDSQNESNIDSAKIDSHKKWIVTHFCECVYIDNVTHWMPLPEPPA